MFAFTTPLMMSTLASLAERRQHVPLVFACVKSGIGIRFVHLFSLWVSALAHQTGKGGKGGKGKGESQ